MLSIQTVSTLKKRSIVAAMLLASALPMACANKEQAAYQLAAQSQQYLEQGDVAQARLLIDKAIRDRDDLVELHLQKGRIELAGKAPDSAFLSYYNGLSLDPVNQEALQSVAMLGLQTGHTDEAETAAGRLLSLSPQNPTALLVKGLLALERKRFSEAIESADRILANAPTDEGAVVLKVRALYLSDSQKEASELVAQTVRMVGTSPGIARISLEIARAEGDDQGMLKAFGQLRQQGQTDLALIFDEANTRYKAGDKVGAATLIQSGLRQDKAPPEQVLGLIQLWQEFDSTAPQRGSLGKIGNPAVRQGLARYLNTRQRFAEAEALIADDNSPTAVAIRSRVLFAVGQPIKARQLAESVISNDKSQCDALVTLGNMALAGRDYPTAVTNGQQAAAECPTDLEGWFIQIRSYMALQQDIQTIRVFREAINRNPDDEVIHSAFVDWLLRSGRGSQALGVSRHLIRYAPNRISSWRLMAKACGGADCRSEATTGLAYAQASFVIDRRPGEPPRRGLFANLRGGVSGK